MENVFKYQYDVGIIHRKAIKSEEIAVYFFVYVFGRAAVPCSGRRNPRRGP